MADAVSALGDEKFVSLTTFKKDGGAVATPMWIGRDGDHVFVWTPADSWKAKRAKNNPRVTLVPCSRGWQGPRRRCSGCRGRRGDYRDGDGSAYWPG